MTTRFAGSHSVDDRRRRRLAGEVDEYDSTTGTVVSLADGTKIQSESGDSTTAGLNSGDVRVSHFPVSRLISPKQWKLWAVGLLGLLVGVNLLLAGTSIAVGEQHLGPGFSHLFDLSAGRALKPMATLMLLLSSQLAWFIWWVRSRSPSDFDGRYRVWCWCAMIGFAATLTVATDLHLVWAKTALWKWEMEFWKHHIVVWLLPVVFVSLVAMRAMHREMRDCRVSLTLLWLAATCGVSIAVLQLGVVTLPLASNDTRLACWSMELGGCWFMFMSLLLHARHVVHVTPDPAQIRKSRSRLKSLMRIPKLPKRTKRAPSKKSQSASKKDDATEKEQESEKEVSTKRRRRKRSTPPADKLAEKEALKKDEPAETPAAVVKESPEPKSSSDPEDESSSDSPDVAAIEMAETDPMQGLSKRERRRLRKQKKSGRKAG